MAYVSSLGATAGKGTLIGAESKVATQLRAANPGMTQAQANAELVAVRQQDPQAYAAALTAHKQYNPLLAAVLPAGKFPLVLGLVAVAGLGFYAVTRRRRRR